MNVTEHTFTPNMAVEPIKIKKGIHAGALYSPERQVRIIEQPTPQQSRAGLIRAMVDPELLDLGPAHQQDSLVPHRLEF